MSYTIAAVDKALDVLEHLAEVGELGVTELAERTGSTKSQIFRLLYTLEQRGFVRKDADSRRYGLGYRTLYIGDKTRHQMDLIRVAQPYLDDLAALSGENAHLVVREGVRSVCIALSESPQPLRLYARVGRRGPLHAGGASMVLLAHAPEEIKRQVVGGELEVFTPTTLVDKASLEKTLVAIRVDDVYESSDDLDEGAFSIAAPVRDHKGSVIAALSVAGPTSRLSEQGRLSHRRSVRDYGEKLSHALGWRKEKIGAVRK